MHRHTLQSQTLPRSQHGLELCAAPPQGFASLLGLRNGMEGHPQSHHGQNRQSECQHVELAQDREDNPGLVLGAVLAGTSPLRDNPKVTVTAEWTAALGNHTRSAIRNAHAYSPTARQ